MAWVPVEHVARNTFDHSVLPEKASHPFTRPGVKHLTLAALEIHDHSATTIDPVERPKPIGRASADF